MVFHITDPRNGTAMGSIMKRFAMREVLTDSNDFGFSILSDTDEVTKAVLIGAVFCIVSCHTLTNLLTARANFNKEKCIDICYRTLLFSEANPQTRTPSIGNGAVGSAHSVL